MACRLRGGPRWLLAAAVGLQGLMLASQPGRGGCLDHDRRKRLLELLAVSGVLLAAPAAGR